jgi:hypothetical protein
MAAKINGDEGWGLSIPGSVCSIRDGIKIVSIQRSLAAVVARGRSELQWIRHAATRDMRVHVECIQVAGLK